jgi:biofilm PGA synthesis N-glycosyltransferase PgaC
MRILFWLSLSILFYTYFGYPPLMMILGYLRPRPIRRKEIQPKVSLVIAAYNEEQHIARKLESSLALEYPRELLEIVVASDGSTDRTVEIARRYEARGVRVLAFERRRGKPSLLNDTIPQCGGEVIVLSDTRQQYDRKALVALAWNFHDPSVGAVSGELHLANDRGIPWGEGVGLYWRYEKFIRWESRFDSLVGASGAIYAIRRDLFEAIPPDTLLDDVLIPLRITRRGYRVVFESEAKAFDCVAERTEEEFVRKVRTIAGTLQLFGREWWLWNIRKNRLFLQAVSHKVMRTWSPFFLTGAFLANAFLVGSSMEYRLVFGGQLLFYGGALAGHLLGRRRTVPSWLAIPNAFCVLNVAALVSFGRMLTGTQAVTWQKASEVARAGKTRTAERT